jgi:UrcA family protein
MNSRTSCTNLRGVIATAIFSALALSFTAVSAAADSNPVRSSVVKFGDLNLSSPEGADTLYRRIRGAASNVCWLTTGADDPAKTLVAGCIHKAVSDAVSKVNNPALFAVYNAKNKPSLPITLTAEQAR